MLVKNYEMPQAHAGIVKAGNSAEVFAESGEIAFNSCFAPSLLVWKGALLDREIEAAMSKNDWALRLLAGFHPDSDWNWKVKGSGDQAAIGEWPEILRKTEEACGRNGQPAGNIALTLQLKEYEDKTSAIGGHGWWMDQESRVGNSDPFVAALYTKIVQMLELTGRSGLDLHIEQITIVISKDKNDQVSTLTPTLHSDMFYGYRETALCSLVEKEVSRFGGTLFVPTIRMDALESERPIDVEKMLRILPDAPILESNSGDVLLYDGMIGHDGVASTQNGIPHISPDLPGQSSRMVILMRNQARRLPPHEAVRIEASA